MSDFLQRRGAQYKGHSDRQLLEHLVEQNVLILEDITRMSATIADLIQEVADNNTTQTELIADVQALLTSQAAGQLTQAQLDSAVGTLETMKTNAKTAAVAIETALGTAQSVTPPPVVMPSVSVSISPTSATMSLAGGVPVQQFSASVSDGSTPTWSCDPAIGSIDQNGLFSATTAGDGHVTATSGAASASASVTVTA